MRYRSLSRGDARRARHQLNLGESFDVGSLGEMCGDGDLLDPEPIESIAEKAIASVEAGTKPEIVEHELSGDIFAALCHVPVEIRDDTGFWRWLTLGPMLRFTGVREPAFGLEALGAGSNTADILVCRMFLRGQVSQSPGEKGRLDFSLATAPGEKTHDFWQSHVLRRSTGAERDLAHALIKMQSDSESKMATDELRPFVRDSVNRKKRTIATQLMTETEASEHLVYERSRWSGVGVDDADDEFG